MKGIVHFAALPASLVGQGRHPCLPVRRMRRTLPNPSLRLVTHLDVSEDDVQKTIAAFKTFFR
jgi:threonine aldolase